MQRDDDSLFRVHGGSQGQVLDLAAWCDGEWSCKWSTGMLRKRREGVPGSGKCLDLKSKRDRERAGQREQVPREMMAAEPLLLQGRNLSHLIFCSKMLLETLSPKWD